jgi:thiamine pyrophosphate-dependent acetolactate synthase large subunit-like protein
MKKVIALAEKMNCPVLTTFKGKGQISDNHPLGCGVLGRSGTPVASWFMNESDALPVIGASFSNHTGITPKKKTVQVDFDPLALSKFHKIDAAVWGEISVTVDLLLQQIQNFGNKVDQRQEIAERRSIWRREKEKRLLEHDGPGLVEVMTDAGLV